MLDLKPVPRRILWRAYVPKWSYDPLSGMGAAQYGGRWNAVGQKCLYASFELSTAWAEYNQGFVQHPALIAQLILENSKLVDLTSGGALESLGMTCDIHAAEWRCELDEGRIPLTHVLAKKLQQMGADGVIYPSFMSRGGQCVALWNWNGIEQSLLTITDPDHRLPKDAFAWL
jgi:RES domain-containing protein